MKVTTNIFFLAAVFLGNLLMADTAGAQQYKLRQSTSMMGMKSETTIYVKAMRKRTEGDGYMGMANLTTIEQCDLQRTIKINDKKKLYFIEPFSKDAEDMATEEPKTVSQKNKAVPVSSVNSKKQTGGVITMWYNVTDTGERKKMYGFTARHIWTTQKMKPSADACTMKDSMIIKTDGWYIDLPQFNCPVQFIPTHASRPSMNNEPPCLDSYVSKRSGKGKLGFPLIEKRTMIMGNGSMQTSEIETSLETLELSTAKLDSMLFEIPLGYRQVQSEEELQDKLDVNEMMKQAENRSDSRNKETPGISGSKKTGTIRIGVFEPKGDEQIEVSALQEHLVNNLSDGHVEAVAISSKEDAKKYQCDLLLTTDFIRVKQGSKVGGLLKAIKNTDPFAVSSYNIEAELTLAKLSDGSTHLQQKVNGKFEGKPGGAAKLALDKGCTELLRELN